MKLRAVLIVSLVTSCVAQDDPKIRVNVRLVNVTFSVRDASGGPVNDLTKDDFEVIDDGAPQTISYFARSADLALTLGLAVDVSGSQGHFVKSHEKDLETFLKDVLGPRDRAFLVCFGNHLRLTSDFSPSSSQLMDGLKGFDKGRGHLPEIGPQEARELGTAFYDALYYSTMAKLATAEGSRKALIVFSDGEDNSSAHHMLDAIEAAQTENVTVFGMRYTEVKKGRLTARNKYGTRVIERVCRETGGVDFDATKADLHQCFRQIGEQLRSSYELAYHSTTASDRTFHKLQIRVKRPGLVVRTKTGYYGRE